MFGGGVGTAVEERRILAGNIDIFIPNCYPICVTLMIIIIEGHVWGWDGGGGEADLGWKNPGGSHHMNSFR